MKLRPIFRSFLTITTSVLFLISNAQADILYWDGADSGANAQGGIGIWDATTLNWDTAATVGADIDWDDSDFAVFVGTAGTVTVGSGIITSGLQFNVHSYVIDASSNALTFATGNNTISTNFTSLAGNITSINGSVGGSGANILFTPVNPTVNARNHVISFGGASSGGWTGTTTIDKNMTVRLQDTNQALLNTSGINLRGGVLLLTNTSAENTLNRVKDDAVINSYGGSIRTNNTVATVDYTESLGELKLIGGNTTLLQMTSQTGANSQLISFSRITREAGSYATLNVGAPMNSLNMIRNASVTTATANNEAIGPWLITGNATSQSDYGRYDVSGNILTISRTGTNNTSLEADLTTAWASTANFSFNGSPTLTANRVMNTLRTSSGAAYQLGNFSLATNGLLAGGGNLTISAPTGSGYLTAAGNSGSGNAIYLNSANGFINLSAPVKDNGTPVTIVLVAGTNGGRIDMNAANEHTGGTVISAPVYRNTAEGQGATGVGAVNLFNTNALGSNTTLLRMESGTLNLNAIAATVGKFEGFASSFVTGTAGTIFTVGNGTASNVTGDFAGTLHNVRLTKEGNGTQILSGTNIANNTTAQYTVNSGTLQFAKTDSFFQSNTANWTKAKTIVNSGGTLAFNVGGSGEFTTANVTTLLTNLAGSNAAGTEGLQAGSRIGVDTTNAAGGTFTLSDAIANSTGAGGGAIGLTKLGTGKLILINTSTYTGQTTISGGALALTGSGSIANSSTIQINSSATLDVTGLTGNFTLGSTQTLSGGGTILATGKTVTVNGTVSAGNSPGTITQSGGTYQLGANGKMNWQIHNAVGAAGVGYDTVSLTNGAVLDLSLLSSLGPYNINLWSLSGIGPDVNGEATNFDNTQNYTWTLISSGAAITGVFNTNLFAINDGAINGTNGFLNDLGGGAFSVGLADGNTDIVLNFTAIPEPKAALLGTLGALLLLRRRRS